MPIKYEIQDDGRFIHATAHGKVTDADFMEYEVAHARDPRLKPPFDELLEIARGAAMQLTRDGILKALQECKELGGHRMPHRCAMVVSCDDSVAWDVAKFYESMAHLHAPSSVIVFASPDIARVWLGRARSQ